MLLLQAARWNRSKRVCICGAVEQCKLFEKVGVSPWGREERKILGLVDGRDSSRYLGGQASIFALNTG